LRAYGDSRRRDERPIWIVLTAHPGMSLRDDRFVCLWLGRYACRLGRAPRLGYAPIPPQHPRHVWRGRKEKCFAAGVCTAAFRGLRGQRPRGFLTPCGLRLARSREFLPPLTPWRARAAGRGRGVAPGLGLLLPADPPVRNFLRRIDGRAPAARGCPIRRHARAAIRAFAGADTYEALVDESLVPAREPVPCHLSVPFRAALSCDGDRIQRARSSRCHASHRRTEEAPRFCTAGIPES
jgi:hypothetical protein